MQSRVAILPGQSVEIGAACTVTFEAHEVFDKNGAAKVPAVWLLVDGVGADLELSQPVEAGSHNVQIIEEDE